MFKDSSLDYERANWAELLLPESIANKYQDNDYREQLQKI